MNRPLSFFVLLVFTLSGCVLVDYEPKEEITPEFGSFTDSRDGTEYATVTLGTQTWMGENLAYLPSVNPSSEGSDDIPFYYVYDYQGSSVAEAKATAFFTDYGVLYSWHAAMLACPNGWHLPSDQEWSDLEISLGSDEVEAERMEWRDVGEVGKKLKSSTGWNMDGNGDNSSGFNALPAGSRDGNGRFSDKGKFGTFWTSTENNISGSWYRAVRRNMDGTYRAGIPHNLGFSLRCIQD